MSEFKAFFFRWGPSILLMVVIYVFSSTPQGYLPDFGSIDYFIKKGGHMLGFGLLAVAYRYGLSRAKNRSSLAWLLTVLYALSDEFHQAFASGRHPSLVDALIFDAAGAAIALWLETCVLTRLRY
jgi:VanZ family protein